MAESFRRWADYAAFPILVLAAWLEGWHPGELAWGLWVSSYFMVMIFASLPHTGRSQRKPD